MRSWRKAAVTAIAAALATLTTLVAPPRAAQATGGTGIEERPCPVPVPAGTTCGYLLAPERRDVPNSKTIKVAFAVHRSAAPDRKPEPVVYASGGPGSSSLEVIGLLARTLPDRDVIVVEQRGGRHSEPRLSCPEIAQALVGTLTTAGPARSEAWPVVKQALACQERLERQHVDLRGYRTAEIAADLVQLRGELGYRRWNLFGVGYATRPVLRAAAADPDGTRAVVLDSFLPAGARWYDQASPALTTAFTALGVGGRFAALVDRLNAEPASFRTRDPLTRKRITVTLTGDDVATLLQSALHDAELIPIVPALVDGLAAGRTGLLRLLFDKAGPGLVSREWGLYYAVQCQDEVPFNTFPADTGPRPFTGAIDAAVCEAWKLPRARDAERATAVPAAGSAGGSTAAPPVLVLGGRYDPATPPQAARQAAASLPGARFAEFAGVGHGVFLGSDCGRRTVEAFLGDPGSTAAPCDPARASRPLILPGEVLVTAAAYTVVTSPVALIPLGVFAVVSAVQLIAALVALLRRRRAGLSALAGLAGVLFSALTALSVATVADPAALSVGVPPELVWYGLLAVAATVLSLIEAFRLNARAIQIVPVLSGLALLAWLYGWLLG